MIQLRVRIRLRQRGAVPPATPWRLSFPRGLAVAVLVALASAALAAVWAAQAAADPEIAAAGDIACSPDDPFFNGGLGSTNSCHQKYTSDLLVNSGLAAVLTLGDNQYETGDLASFLSSFDPSWGRAKSIMHPAVGNHEYGTSGAAGYFDYFNGAGNLTGPAGDRANGYYSFDIGRWHLIALNTNDNGCGIVACSAGSPQEQWLRADLAAHPSACTLAYWHHPRFTSSAVGGDATYTQALWQDLYNARADVVLNGHRHGYERFAPQSPSGLLDPTNGIREFVVGTGGVNFTAFRSTPEPNSEVRQNSTFGVLVLTLHPTGYDWRFTPEAGKTFSDSGTGLCHNAQPAALALSPKSGTDSAGTSHCVTATVTDAYADPNPGVSVVFSVSGANSAGPSPVASDQNGQAPFCYTGTSAGADAISAFADTNQNGAEDPGEPSDSASETYTAAQPAALALSPKSGTDSAGTSHCVTATVTDAYANPNPGVSVVFSVSGANSAGPSPVASDQNGQAPFCYTGTSAGADAISAFADTNQNGAEDPGEPSDSASETYTPLPYDVPASASSLSVSLVPAFRETISLSQCLARGGTPSTHGAPLAVESCNPPDYVPVTIAHLGPQASGSAQLTATPADVAIAANLADVHAGSATGSDYDPNPSGADTTLAVKLRISDTFNGSSQSDPATVQDFDFQAPVDCQTTSDPAIGATCSASTTANAIIPGIIQQAKAMVVQAFRVRLNDAGSDGTEGNADDRLFAQQGIYIP